MASITSIVKASDWILSRPTLSKVIIPVAKTFCAYAGYREMGLKYVSFLFRRMGLAENNTASVKTQTGLPSYTNVKVQ